MTSALGFLALCAGIAVTSAAEWSYSAEHGIPPDQWGKVSATCDLNSQSPIDVFEGDVSNAISDPIVYQNYDTIQNLLMNVTNNGHTAVVTLSGTNHPRISGGNLQGNFQAVQFHFHWGSRDSQGSEHELNGQAFPMELHIVHYNTKYTDIGAALSHPDGIAVLGFFYQVSANDNNAYAGLISSLEQLQSMPESAQVVVNPMTLNSLLPATKDRFFRYAGSLTTPNCQEAVTWTVFKDAIMISEKQLQVFRDLVSDDNVPLQDNFRPVQDYNGRLVTSNFDTDVHWGYKPPLGPGHWADYYQACGGTHQSPINYPASASTLEPALTAFTFTGYDRTDGITMKLKNTGHSAQVDITGGLISVSGSDLDEPFVADQFHFHWGKDSTRGSEHYLDGKVFPMEMHIVHHRESLGSLAAAATVPEGLTVLGFFFTVSENDNPAFEAIITGLSSVRTPGAELPMTTMSLDSLLPTNRADYYRYSGSLTTPGCYATVKWVLFQDTIDISESQLAAFRTLVSEEDNMAMVDNFRPVQLVTTSSFRRSFQLPPTPEWSYAGSHGPSHWEELFSSCSSLSTAHQSPIDIVLSDLVYDRNMAVHQLYTQATYDLSNDGHSVKATIQPRRNLTIMPTDDLYELVQFHFHWGTNNMVGSEHLIDSETFPMEIHLVHFNQRYGSVGIAATQANGLAVLGIMVEVSPMDNPALKPIVDRLDNIKSAGSQVSGVPFDVRAILPPRMDHFFRYHGGLTTPPCHESVLWHVFDESISISQAQLDKFREVLSKEKDSVTGAYKPIENNFRPVQPLNGRTVYINFVLGGRASSVSQARGRRRN